MVDGTARRLEQVGMMRFDYEPDAMWVETVSRRLCGRCAGEMIELSVSTRLSVQRSEPMIPEEQWTATPIDAWTCVSCGKTELFARNPKIFR